ncbi:MAG: hypothetical protein LUE89_09360, partial [Clostridiales bacterium]|nr:hypothetical protein [Clostridiales bacterium]
MASLTTEEKAGQLFCVLGDANTPATRMAPGGHSSAVKRHFRCAPCLHLRKSGNGHSACASEGLIDLVENYHVSGVLFRPNPQQEVKAKYDSLDQYAKVPLTLKGYFRSCASPWLKAANLEEGGAGVLSDGTYFGSELQVAAANDLTCTEAFAKTCALEGRSVGVNWTFSPVVDIDVNFRNPIYPQGVLPALRASLTNVRTFGSDPDKVLANASTFVRTIQKYGVAASCKHFPGDGVDYRDQHLHPTYCDSHGPRGPSLRRQAALPLRSLPAFALKRKWPFGQRFNDLSAEEWYATYGKVYQTLIDEGLMSVMVGHIVQPNVIRAYNPHATEADLLPGSQSKELLTGVLRNQFGFNGVIITDATATRMAPKGPSLRRQAALPLRSLPAFAQKRKWPFGQRFHHGRLYHDHA